MTPKPVTSQADSTHGQAATRLGGRLLAACGLLLAALSAGCTQKPLCSELGSCGGNPVGDWVLDATHQSCSEDLYLPPSDTRLDHGDQPAARTPPAEEALYDWCDLLVTNGGQKVATVDPRFSFESGTIGTAFVHYDPIGANGSGTYAAGLTRIGTYTIEFPALCIREFGAEGDVCGALQTQLVSSSTHKNLQCVANPSDPAGCVCRFDVAVQSGGSGVYQMLDDHTLIHELNLQFPSKAPAAAFPQKVTFCSQGGSLQLTGTDATYLFDEPGLRTMELAQTTINCTDGVKGPGEEGVDCGLACPTACTM
jgi:hypothetical protein